MKLPAPDTRPRSRGGVPDQAQGTDTFEEFCADHYGRLVAYAYGHTQNRDRALDAVQNALTDILSRWDHVKTPLAYARTAILNNIRSDQQRHQRDLARAHLAHAGDVISYDSTDSLVRQLALTTLVRNLPPMQQSAVVLHYFEGWPVHEIAGFLSVRESTVRANLTHARQRLKELLTPAATAQDYRKSPPPNRAADAPAAVSRPTPQRTQHIADLVARTQAGESSAFAALYDRFADTVYQYLYFRVGQRTAAEDLTARTFLRAMRRIHLFTWQARDFSAWLMTIARNLAADYMDTTRFRLHITGDGVMLPPDPAPYHPAAPQVPVPANAGLIEVIGKLSPAQQECITLRFLQGLSVTETARILGKNEGAVKTLQHRALRALAGYLPEYPNSSPRPAASAAPKQPTGLVVSQALHVIAVAYTRTTQPSDRARVRMRALLEEEAALA